MADKANLHSKESVAIGQGMLGAGSGSEVGFAWSFLS